jgi:glycine dehydrogenase
MNTNSFAQRHIGPRKSDLNKMLKTIGLNSMEELINETIPEDILLKERLSLNKAMSEQEYQEHNNLLSVKNKLFKTYIGLGYHNSFLPPVIQRNILENPGWYSAYSPYQAEIAQGRLEALINFQTTVSDLTGMELANASLLDEATAAAEAMSLLYSLRDRTQKKKNIGKFFVSEEVLPQTISLLKTRSIPLGIELVIGNHQEFDFSSEYFGVLLQYPGKFGQIYNYQSFVQKAKESLIKVAVAADILSLVMLESPGNFGVDVVVGSTQRFGIPLGYGGPHAGYFATKSEYKRNIPGRIIGITKDMDNNMSYRMALQTREQHIKRDRATSNICTAQVLLAVMAGMYAVYHGPEGLKHIANNIHNTAATLAVALENIGYSQLNSAFFDTIVIKADKEQIKSIAEKHEINFYYIDKHTISISLNETTSLKDLNAIIAVFNEATNNDSSSIESLLYSSFIPAELERKTPFLTNDVFNSYHSETEMMRYIKKLERKDLSLNHSMIPLGSCTMKLNAASEMLPLSNPNWSSIHPFVPVEQAQGYQEMLTNLENQLTEITGFAATSLQPNSGAQGEFAGLMVIKAYHESRNDHHRNICLIPSSAHGTNPASAVMAGMKVIVTKATEEGNINVDDLREKAILYKDNLSALMITYPSTHGVYEASIKEITGIIHENGGQVYMDGANMNAQVALTNPGAIGADVCHLNLHKTFAIPHGGGGPGMGPIGVGAHLKPFLPNNPFVEVGGEKGIEPVTAAPFGSALILLISYSYIKLLGKDGLKRSTEIAILNANYIAKKLENHYDILYKGSNGKVAHEMILDCRDFKKTANVEVADIAKRLIDFGFHAPTVSFPVAGTLMIEPTESEDKDELDRFIEAMIKIREELKEIEDGHVDNTNNLLKNAPHTADCIINKNWNYSYSPQEAAYPLPYTIENKYWVPVRRVDNAFGDRNLVCSCPGIESYVNP